MYDEFHDVSTTPPADSSISGPKWYNVARTGRRKGSSFTIDSLIEALVITSVISTYNAQLYVYYTYR